MTQLLSHYDAVLEALEGGSDGYDTIYLNFSKAFDKVNHEVLLHKLRALGIHGKIGVWLARFLSDLYQIVVCDGHQSEKSLVSSGVPQGTVLGPILFLILILDIDKGVSDSSRVSSFADNTRGSPAITEPSDHQQLQTDLDSIYKWAAEVNMVYNSDKFECLRH